MSGDLELAAEAVSETLDDFRAQCDEWRQEFDLLMDELDGLPEPDSASQQALGNMIAQLSEHQRRVVQRQDDIGEEMVAVHLLVERQVDLLDRLLDASQQTHPATD